MTSSRRNFIQNISVLTGGLILNPIELWPAQSSHYHQSELNAAMFGESFAWGTASAAAQSEGAWNTDGRGPSIWDIFTEKKSKIKNCDNARVASDFYNRYPEDLAFHQQMNFGNFRFSLSWSRILPNGTGYVNRKGIDYYNRLIDSCLEKNITPWITIYHWDLPQALEEKGGWTNREILGWFEEYCILAAMSFGDRVKNWIILNEPMAFTSFGYLLGTHAPGRRGIKNFMPAVHHAALCQSLGSRVIRKLLTNPTIGSTFSCSKVEPVDSNQKNLDAAVRIDAVLNRLFLEPALGLGYPIATLPFLKQLHKHFKPGDEDLLKADFDFVGLQYYFRVVAKHSALPPLHAKQIKPEKRNAEINSMGLEVFPEGISSMLEQFSAYENIKKIYITECGVCFYDMINPDGTVTDTQRIDYFKTSLEHVLKSKNKGIPVEGFFVWSLTDNFEWNFGYSPRFGLVYIDYATQKRRLKDSGKWFMEFLSK